MSLQPLIPATHPTSPAPKIYHVEFILNRNIAIKLITKVETVRQSVTEAFPSCQPTTAINARDPTTTPSNTAPAVGDRRILGISGPLTATNTNPGRKIPSVAKAAPGNPPTR